MKSHAVCYVATEGYMFSTALSAVQARTFTGGDTDVVVVFLGDESSKEYEEFKLLFASRGVHLIVTPPAILGGLHPTYARLFLDRILPPEVTEILYLDGDTQVVADIDPLVHAEVSAGRVLAARDPMVFIRQVNPRLRRKIDEWWDSSKLSLAVRERYVNAGVLRFGRNSLVPVRDAILTGAPEELAGLRFRDQDMINVVLAERLGQVSMSWNYPGFLLGTQVTELTPPKIIHFMSAPRPWNAALHPWGSAFHKPYVQLVVDHPGIAPYWTRLSRQGRLRYVVQQQYKRYTERPYYESLLASRTVQDLERGTAPLV